MLPRLARRLCAYSLSLSFGVGTLPVIVGGQLDFLVIPGAAFPLRLCYSDWARRFLFIFLGRSCRIFGFQLFLLFRLGWFRFLRWRADDIFLSWIAGYLRFPVLSGDVGPLVSMCSLPAVISDCPGACSKLGYRLSRSVSFVFLYGFYFLVLLLFG